MSLLQNFPPLPSINTLSRFSLWQKHTYCQICPIYPGKDGGPGLQLLDILGSSLLQLATLHNFPIYARNIPPCLSGEKNICQANRKISPTQPSLLPPYTGQFYLVKHWHWHFTQVFWVHSDRVFPQRVVWDFPSLQMAYATAGSKINSLVITAVIGWGLVED